MKEGFRTMKKDRFVRYSAIGSVILLVMTVFFTVASYSRLPPLVPLLNSLPWGEERLVPSSFILLLPLASFVVFSVNSVWAMFLYNRYALAARILYANSSLFVFLGFLACLQILFLVL